MHKTSPLARIQMSDEKIGHNFLEMLAFQRQVSYFQSAVNDDVTRTVL